MKRDAHPRADDEPCSHPGCAHHVSHPCEGCGRIEARGEYRPWVNQFLGEFWAPSHARLRKLAREYLKVTEDYDQMICAHRKGNIAIPVTREERELSFHFAWIKKQEYMERAEKEGLIGEMSFWQAVRAEEREFERTYRFELTEEDKSAKIPS